MCSFRSQRTTRSAVSVEGRGRRRGSGRRPDVAVGIPAHSGRSRDYRPPRHPPRQSSGGTQIPSILASAQYPSITSIWVPGPCGSVTAYARGMWHVRWGCAHYAVREGERAYLPCALSMARSIQKSLPKRVGRCFFGAGHKHTTHGSRSYASSLLVQASPFARVDKGGSETYALIWIEI